jgi:predicted enzyme related to lactoylglutathione lyase
VLHAASLRRTAFAVTFAAAGLVGACTMASRPDLSGMSFTSEPLIGKVIWCDLITEDIDTARRFYGGLFGWTFEESSTRGNDYLLARDGNVYVAGLVAIERPGDGTHLSRWLPYVSVADVDDAVEKSLAAGARLAAPARDVGLGRVAAIVDPQGAVIGLVRSAVGDPDDRTTAAAPGRVVWSELLADDPAAAAGFYRTVVGYTPRTVERRRGAYTFLAGAGGDRAGILANPSKEWEPLWLTYFGVDDPRAAAATAAELGGHIVLEPSPGIREGSMAVVTDPSGAVLVLQRWSVQQEAAQ